MNNCIILTTLALAGCAPQPPAAPPKVEFAPTPVEYERGVNNALTAFILLNLEQELKGERRNFGEMAEIVCKRLNVQNTLPKSEN